MNIAWPAFNGYTEGTEGVTRDDLEKTILEVESATRPKEEAKK